MRLRCGLTTWNVAIGRAGFIWRWNMPLGEAFRTCALRRCGAHGYVTAGPLIVEW